MPQGVNASFLLSPAVVQDGSGGGGGAGVLHFKPVDDGRDLKIVGTKLDNMDVEV